MFKNYLRIMFKMYILNNLSKFVMLSSCLVCYCSQKQMLILYKISPKAKKQNKNKKKLTNKNE